MGQLTGDLLAKASGSASLGAEQRDGRGGFTGDIRPYAHVHMLSGVWHANAGESGVLRFGLDALGNPIFECSTNGGITFGDLPHSGQIQEAINAAVTTGGGGGIETLQEAYEGNNNIFTSASQGGPVNLVGTDVPPIALAVGSSEDVPHVHISGLIGIPSQVENRGDLWLQNHTAGWEAQLDGGSEPTDQATAEARSLGPALLFYNNGSGVTNISVASGIGQFSNLLDVAFDQNTNAILDGVVSQFPSFSDSFYTQVNNSGVRINVGGAYKISFLGGVEKTDGNYWQQVVASVRIRDKFGKEFTLLGLENTISIRDSDSINFTTSTGSSYGDLDVGDTLHLRFEASSTPLPDFDKVSVQATRAVLNLEYVGPKRFGKLNRVSRLP
jgi:hypothetical protein